MYKINRGWYGPEVGQSSRVSTRGCVPSSYTIVSIRVLNYKKKKNRGGDQERPKTESGGGHGHSLDTQPYRHFGQRASRQPRGIHIHSGGNPGSGSGRYRRRSQAGLKNSPRLLEIHDRLWQEEDGLA